MRIFIVSLHSPNDNFTASNRIRYIMLHFKRQGIPVNFLHFEQFKKHRSFGILGPLLSFLYLIFLKSDRSNFLFSFRRKQYRFTKEDIIICSGPPFSTFEIGWYIKKKYGSKLIVDYRDPWNFSYKTIDTFPLVFKLKKYFTQKKELTLLSHADAVCQAAEGMIQMPCPKTATKLFTIENGSNEEEIREIQNNHRPKKFELIYPGSLYKEQIKDEQFFRAFKRFTDKKKGEAIQMTFLGSGKRKELSKLIEKYGLENWVETSERVNLKEALKRMSGAWMFVLFPYTSSNAVPSSKLYDCLHLSKKILLTKNDYGLLEKIIFETESGYVCNKEEEIIDVLELEYSRFLLRQSEKINRTSEQIKQFSRHQKNKKWEEVVQFISNS